MSAHIIGDVHHHLAVAEASDLDLSQRQVQITGNLHGQARVGIAGKNHHVGL